MTEGRRGRHALRQRWSVVAGAKKRSGARFMAQEGGDLRGRDPEHPQAYAPNSYNETGPGRIQENREQKLNPSKHKRSRTGGEQKGPWEGSGPAISYQVTAVRR